MRPSEQTLVVKKLLDQGWVEVSVDDPMARYVSQNEPIYLVWRPTPKFVRVLGTCVIEEAVFGADKRIEELLAANNREVERRRDAERKLEQCQDQGRLLVARIGEVAERVDKLLDKLKSLDTPISSWMM